MTKGHVRVIWLYILVATSLSITTAIVFGAVPIVSSLASGLLGFALVITMACLYRWIEAHPAADKQTAARKQTN